MRHETSERERKDNTKKRRKDEEIKDTDILYLWLSCMHTLCLYSRPSIKLLKVFYYKSYLLMMMTMRLLTIYYGS